MLPSRRSLFGVIRRRFGAPRAGPPSSRRRRHDSGPLAPRHCAPTRRRGVQSASSLPRPRSQREGPVPQHPLFRDHARRVSRAQPCGRRLACLPRLRARAARPAHCNTAAAIRRRRAATDRAAIEDAAAKANRHAAGARALARRRRFARNRRRAVSSARAGSTLGDDVAGDVLRWHPRIGAMLALFRNIQTGEPQAISRTFLDREGRKIERKFLGPVAGAAIMLDSFDLVTTGLHVGEGVETCMAARQLGLRPCWALGSRGRRRGFPDTGRRRMLDAPQGGRRCERARRARPAPRGGTRQGAKSSSTSRLSGKDLNDAIRVRGAS